MSLLDGLRYRLRAFFRPGATAAERDEEFRFHLAVEEMHRRQAGLDPAAARLASRKAFGNVAGYQEEVRRMSALERVRTAGRTFRHALRQLARAPGFTAAVVITLALGIGGVTAIGAVVDGVLLRPLPLADPDRLAAVRLRFRSMGIEGSEHSDAAIFSFEKFGTTTVAMGAVLTTDLNLGEPPEIERIRGARVTAGFFSVLGVAPLLGQPFDSSLDRPGAPPVIVLSEGFWRRRFHADPAVVGTKLLVQGQPSLVLGVMPRAAQAYPGGDVQVWVPLGLDPDHVLPASSTYRVVARLKPGVTLEAAERDFQQALMRLPTLYPDAGFGISTRSYLDLAKPSIVVRPLRDEVVADVGSILWVLLGTAGFVLLVAAANVATLFLVRAESRRREMAVRIALGSPRVGVISHLLTEGLVVAAAGGGIALLLTAAALSVWTRRGLVEIPRLDEVGVSGATLALTAALTLLVALASCALPIARIRSLALAPALRSGGRGTTSGIDRQRARQGLVVGQVALAFALLAGSGLLARTYWELRSVKPGFDPRGVLVFRVALPVETRPRVGDVARFFEAAANGLRVLPGVRAVGAISGVPLQPFDGISHNAMWIEDQPERDITKSAVALQWGMGDVFSALGIPVVAGHGFERVDPDRASFEAIVNESAVARFWPKERTLDVLGRHVRLSPTGEWLTVVGVVGDTRSVSLDQPPEPTIYLPPTSDWLSSARPGSPNQKLADLLIPRVMSLVLRGSGPPDQWIGPAKRVIRALDPTLPIFATGSLQSIVQASTARTTFAGWMLAIAAGVALLLGLVGVYGVIAYTASIRTRELGLRLALGARPGEIRLMMVGQGMRLVGAGIVGGVLLTTLLTGTLRALLYGVGRNDPITLLVVALTLGLAGLAATWVPATRAGRVDPAVTLAGE